MHSRAVRTEQDAALHPQGGGGRNSPGGTQPGALSPEEGLEMVFEAGHIP